MKTMEDMAREINRLNAEKKDLQDVINYQKNGTTLTVLNDNNFPGSSGRNAKLADDNEIIQTRLPKALF